MKEFDKWYQNQFNKDGTLKGPYKHYRWKPRDIWAEDAWKAALEWVSEFIVGNELGYEIYDRIKEELDG